MLFLEAGKLSYADARGEYVKCVYNVANNLKNLDALESEQKRVIKEQYWKKMLAEELDEMLYAPRTDFELWNKWLEEQGKKLCRQKAFCFTGESRVGKSEFVKCSLKGGIFICTCANHDEPDLREFKGPPEEMNIMFDEASPKLVSDHRDLFQAVRHPVSLGKSATNCYAYKVQLWRVRMVICTNKWHEQLVELSPSDQDWLAKNVYVQEVHDSCFTTIPIRPGQN